MNLKESFLFFKNLHKDQKYSDGSPYRPHLLRVGNILQYYLESFGEGNEKTRNTIIIAGYGHDSLEDTDITKEELQKQFNADIVKLIFGMTNEQNDTHTDEYVRKIATASEEVRLIKLADICDNYTSMTYRFVENGSKFLKKKIMPIIEPMYQKIIKTDFVKYKKTGSYLVNQAISSHDIAKKILNLELS